MEKFLTLFGKFSEIDIWGYVGIALAILGGVITVFTAVLLIAEGIAKLTKTTNDDVVISKWKKRLQKGLGYVQKYSSKLTLMQNKVDKKKLDDFDKAVADAVAKLKTEETVELDESGKGTEPEKEDDSTEEKQEG